MKKNAKWIFIIWLVLCCVSFDFVLAEGESVVKKVLVYSDRAMVTRDQNIDVTAGRRSILFTNLPTTMDRRSVRVSGKGTASVKILDVQVKSQFFTQASRVDNRELEKEVLQLQRQKATLQDRQGVLQKSQEFLERLLDRTLDAIAKDKNPQTVSIDKYKQMSLLLEEKLSTISQENRKISWQIQELDVQTETLRKQININPVASQKESCNVIVEVEVKRAGNLLLSLSYLMPNASWSPAYDLYIANEQEKDAFVYSAYVKQQTGEDWLDSQLTLSTAQPMVVTTLPNLNPVYLDLMAVGNGMISGTCFLDDGSRIPGLNIEVSGASSKKRTTITNANGYYQIVGLPEGIYTVRASLEGLNSFNRSGISVRGGRNSIVDIYMRIASIAEEVVVAGGVPVIDRQITEQEIRPEPPAPLVEALTETTKPKQGEISTSFAVQYQSTVASGIEAKKVTLLSDSISIEKEFVAVPSRSNEVILKAKLKNTLDAPLLAGPLNIFFEGSFVNTTHIRNLYPGETFEIPLGVDPGVEVKREALEKETTIKGLFKKTSNIPLGYKITIKNKKNIPIKVNVADQIPVAINDKIKIKIETIKPLPEKVEEKQENLGFLNWLITVEPGQETVILVKYTISFPKDSVLDQG